MDCRIKAETIESNETNIIIPPHLIKEEQEIYPLLVTAEDLRNENLLNENFIECKSELNLQENTKTDRKYYNCSQCGEEFPEEKYVQVHKAIHNPDLHCPVCDRIFKFAKYFVQHIQSHLINPLSCQQCSETFLDKRLYSQHVLSHRKSKTYTCEYCSKVWYYKKDLQVHIRVHTNERPYPCEVCGKSFKQKGALISHINRVHQGQREIKEKFSCEICNGLYTSVSNLNKHVRLIHGTGKTFPCKKCGKTFLNFFHMKQHKLKAHAELVYSAICPVCKEEFSCREAYVKHVKTHNESGQEIEGSSLATAVNCYLCGEQAIGTKAIAKHLQSHLLMTDEELNECIKIQKFPCKLCKKLFKYKKNLIRHMDNHLEKNFQCGSHCTEKFTYLGMRRHVEWHFEQFHCTECNETFIGRKNLRKHYKVHRNTDSFICKICGHSFRYRRLLLVHWKLQHNLKCHICFKNFKTHLALKKHINDMHKIKYENLKNVEKCPTVKIKNRRLLEYVCKICRYPCYSKLQLKYHAKLHKKKCFQCNSCRKNFLYFRNWIFHMKQKMCLKYHNDRFSQHNCVICKKAFGTQDFLIEHIRSHSTYRKCKFCNCKFKQMNSLKDLLEHINQVHPTKVKYPCNKCNFRVCSRADLIKHKKVCHRVNIIKTGEENNHFENNDMMNKINIINTGEVLPEREVIWIKEEPNETQSFES